MSDDGMMPDGWTSEELAAQRESLAQLAGTARVEDLPRLANIVDLLDVLDAVNAGTVTADEARDAMRATHKEVMPSARITWHAAEPDHVGRGWSVHPSDITEKHLAEMLPLLGPALGTMSAMCERLWVQTTGDPDAIDADKTAITFGAATDGKVFFGMTSASEYEDDDEALLVAQVGLALPIATAKALRNDLNRAIARATLLRRRHVATARVRLQRRLVDSGMPEDHASAIGAAAEASVETGLPQVVIGPDGASSTVVVNPDGTISYEVSCVDGGEE
jgi:hypothetical protein